MCKRVPNSRLHKEQPRRTDTRTRKRLNKKKLIYYGNKLLPKMNDEDSIQWRIERSVRNTFLGLDCLTWIEEKSTDSSAKTKKRSVSRRGQAFAMKAQHMQQAMNSNKQEGTVASAFHPRLFISLQFSDETYANRWQISPNVVKVMGKWPDTASCIMFFLTTDSVGTGQRRHYG